MIAFLLAMLLSVDGTMIHREVPLLDSPLVVEQGEYAVTFDHSARSVGEWERSAGMLRLAYSVTENGNKRMGQDLWLVPEGLTVQGPVRSGGNYFEGLWVRGEGRADVVVVEFWYVRIQEHGRE